MKILVFNINQNTVSRGTETFWRNLKTQLEKKEIRVEIIPSSKKHEQNKSNKFFHKILRRIYLDGYSLHVLLFTLCNIKHAVDSKPDIIIPTNGGWQTIIVRLIRRMGFIGKSKIVMIGHAGIGHDDAFNVRHGGADLFVAITEAQASWAKKINTKLKVVHIPNGIDMALFYPTGEKFDYHLPKPVFLTVATLEKYKNVDATIDAVSQLSKGSLVIIGDGQEKEKLRVLCENKLANRYLIIKVDHHELPKYYRGADVFTLVSGSQEAFGLVYLEAMACGLPVVATDDEKRHEIIGDAGLFVNPINIEEYKTALMKAAIINWDDKPKKQSEKFSWDTIGEKYDSLLNTTI